jgi:DNA helicase-2/ATP-dependent DNA helicase PcrA
VVGDDFQSIYSWRGADFRNIMSFPVRYPDAKVYKLETNYRSVPEILAVANACIAGNPEQFQKTLRAVRPEQPQALVAEMRAGEEQSRLHPRPGRPAAPRRLPLREICRALPLALPLDGAADRDVAPAHPLRDHLGRALLRAGPRQGRGAALARIVATAPPMNSPSCRLLALLPKVGERTARKLWNALDGRFNTDVRSGYA